jgi:coenzyme F420 hydrogenase subunit beta
MSLNLRRPAVTLGSVTVTEPRQAPERWKLEWADLYNEVVTSGLCTGCAACIVACPHDVLGYNTADGVYRPFHLEEELGPGGCSHGLRGCTSCTRACPRFRNWETEADTLSFGRARLPEEQSGVSRSVLLARAMDPELLATGQDGGVVSALLLWCLEHDRIDAALVSALEGDGSGWRAVPAVARTRAELMAAAGSRYTYSANTLAYAEAVAGGAERIALVGMGCQASAPVVMRARKAGKVGRRLALSIGLMCSKTFDDSIFEEFFDAQYGLKRSDIAKINIKGVFQIWCRDGSYHEVPLKEGHAWTREGCKSCPDFAAEHADISTGGIGALSDWTLTVVRTELGQEIIDEMVAGGALEVRPGDDDPGALTLMARLATVSRRRWPVSAVPEPRLGVPPPKVAQA